MSRKNRPGNCAAIFSPREAPSDTIGAVCKQLAGRGAYGSTGLVAPACAGCNGKEHWRGSTKDFWSTSGTNGVKAGTGQGNSSRPCTRDEAKHPDQDGSSEQAPIQPGVKAAHLVKTRWSCCDVLANLTCGDGRGRGLCGKCWGTRGGSRGRVVATRSVIG